MSQVKLITIQIPSLALRLYELLNWEFPQGRDQPDGGERGPAPAPASLAFVLISRINYQETQYSLDFRRSQSQLD